MSISTDSVNVRLMEFLHIRPKVDADIIQLDENAGNLSRLIHEILDSSMDALCITNKKDLPKLKNIRFKLNVLNKRILRSNPITSNAKSAKEHLVKVIEENSKLLDEAVSFGKYSFSPLAIKGERSSYSRLSSFMKAKTVWRSSIFAERLDWAACLTDSRNHPEWPVFLEAMKQHVDEPKIIKQMWDLTIKGIERQNNLNKIGKKKDPNPEFEELAKLLNKLGLLSPKAGEPFALWSGGFDVSLYAQFKNFTTLEKTKAGQIFNALSLYTEWSPLGPLWNNLSSQFAKNAESDVHVFFRVQDPWSVLERQELVEIAKSGTRKNLVFHPMINKGKNLDALDILELSLSLKKEKEDPRIFLKNVLIKVCQGSLGKDPELSEIYKKNLAAIKQMKLD